MKKPDRIFDPYDHIIDRFTVTSHRECSHEKVTGKRGRIWSDLVGTKSSGSSSSTTTPSTTARARNRWHRFDTPHEKGQK